MKVLLQAARTNYPESPTKLSIPPPPVIVPPPMASDGKQPSTEVRQGALPSIEAKLREAEAVPPLVTRVRSVTDAAKAAVQSVESRGRAS